jgi:hypothetical protein
VWASMMPEMGNSIKIQNRAIETIARLLNGFFDVFILVIFYFTDGDNCSMWTSFYAFQASYTFIGMRHFGMFVPKKVHLAKNFLRAGVEAFPASLALMMINQDSRYFPTVAKKFVYHICVLKMMAQKYSVWKCRK